MLTRGLMRTMGCCGQVCKKEGLSREKKEDTKAAIEPMNKSNMESAVLLTRLWEGGYFGMVKITESRIQDNYPLKFVG